MRARTAHAQASCHNITGACLPRFEVAAWQPAARCQPAWSTIPTLQAFPPPPTEAYTPSWRTPSPCVPQERHAVAARPARAASGTRPRTGDVLGDDEQRLVDARQLLQQRQHVLDALQLLVGDQHARVVVLHQQPLLRRARGASRRRHAPPDTSSRTAFLGVPRTRLRGGEEEAPRKPCPAVGALSGQSTSDYSHAKAHAARAPEQLVYNPAGPCHRSQQHSQPLPLPLQTAENGTAGACECGSHCGPSCWWAAGSAPTARAWLVMNCGEM